MPRRKANDRVGPVKTRSRAGCSECRASRVRCDTKKPVCSRCQEKRLVCSTQLVLKWESEFVSRGIAFGRAGVWSKSKAGGTQPSTPSPSSSSDLSPEEREWCVISRVEPWSFINSSLEAFELPFRVDIADDEHAAVVVRDKGESSLLKRALELRMMRMTGPLPPLSLFPQITELNCGHLFEYYIRQVCPRMSASRNSSSPFASIIVPFSSTASPTLFAVIQALGACAWSRADRTYGVVALRLKSEALRGLRNRLATAGPLTCSSDPELLVVMMMLCLYELVDNCDQRWTIHLRGAKELIRLRRQKAALPSPHQDAVTSLAEQFFAFQDIMGRTACGEKAIFGADYWLDNEHNVDPWMGCSPKLVSILSDITELSRTRRQLVSDSGKAALSMKAATLSRQLEKLVQNVDEEDDNLRAVAELKRLAAILYLQCALHNASPSIAVVVSYVRRILRLVSHLLNAGSLIGVAWPVFVAAVELDPLNDELWKDDGGREVYGRPLVLRALAAMAESSVLSVARTRAVIVQVWQARDNNVQKGGSRNAVVDSPSCNDWECYVTPFSIAMSLA